MRTVNFIQIHPEYPDTWGSSFWITAHTVAAGYPKTPTSEEQKQFKIYFDTFEHILPCKECKENWKLVVEQRPLTDAALTTTVTLSRWVLDVHNLVNEKLGKKQYNWKQLTYRFGGIEDPQKRIIKKISLSPESVSGSSLIPDTSLGTVHFKTPAGWRNAMINVNVSPKLAVQYVTTRETHESYGHRGNPRRKKCGCAK